MFSKRHPDLEGDCFEWELLVEASVVVPANRITNSTDGQPSGQAVPGYYKLSLVSRRHEGHLDPNQRKFDFLAPIQEQLTFVNRYAAETLLLDGNVVENTLQSFLDAYSQDSQVLNLLLQNCCECTLSGATDELKEARDAWSQQHSGAHPENGTRAEGGACGEGETPANGFDLLTCAGSTESLRVRKGSTGITRTPTIPCRQVESIGGCEEDEDSGEISYLVRWSGHHEDDTDFLTEESLQHEEGGERALSKYLMAGIPIVPSMMDSDVSIRFVETSQSL